MKIKEICQKCGLSERTVRYYCEQKLIEVESYTQNGREYLNFSEKNVEELRAIAVLRQANFSIDEIRSMICEPHLIRRIVGEHTRALAAQSRESDRVVEAFAELDTMHLSGVEDVVRVLENKPAHSTVAALKPGEMTFSEFCEAAGYCRDDSLFLEDDRRVVRGRRIFIVYMIFAITNTITDSGFLANFSLNVVSFIPPT